MSSAPREPRERSAPPKPRRQLPPAVSDGEDGFSDDDYAPVKPRRGHHSRSPDARKPQSILDDEAETTIGAAVKMKGELSFERLLRIEGEFDGKLTSKGSLVVGPKGQLTGDVNQMKEVVLDGGRIVGNVFVDKITLRAKAEVHGNITAKTIKVDPGCIILGELNINPHAPDKINLKGEPVKADAPTDGK